MTSGMLRPMGSPPRPPSTDERAARASLAASVLDGRVFVDVEVPRTNVRARMRMLTRAEAKQVRHESRQALVALGLEGAASSSSPEAFREWHEEIVTRTIAVAVRALDSDTALASLDEWAECHDDQIEILFDRYRDLEHQLNPLSAQARGVTEAQIHAMRDAAKKKDVALLLSYGSCALATYAITTVEPPSS